MNKESNKTQYNYDSAHALVHQLLECAVACEACASACLNESEVEMMTRCIELDRDCADTCIHTAKLVMRNSEIGAVTLAACEQICRICAEECGKHKKDHCQDCADACDRCADACHEHHGSLQLS